MRLEINYKKKKVQKNTDMWQLTICYLTTKASLKKSERKLKKYLEANESENMTIQNYGM